MADVGTSPNGLALNAAGTRLYSCNQRGDNIAVFRADSETGGLALTGHYASVGNPSAIVFLNLWCHNKALVILIRNA